MISKLLPIKLQLFADGGGTASGGEGAGPGDGAATGAIAGAETKAKAKTVEKSGDDGRSEKLLSLGVPKDKIRGDKPYKNAAWAKKSAAAENSAAENAPSSDIKKQGDNPRLTWDELMKDPEYNKNMRDTVSNRVAKIKEAQDTLEKLSPALMAIAAKYNLNADDVSKIDPAALSLALENEKASQKLDTQAKEAQPLQRPIDTMQIPQNREKQVRARFDDIIKQANDLSAKQPSFNLTQELENPKFLRLISPDSPLTLEEAYFSAHRDEIESELIAQTTKRTAEKIAGAVRSGSIRPIENGLSKRAPTVTYFDYRSATKEQRESIKRQIRSGAANGRKVYPGSV